MAEEAKKAEAKTKRPTAEKREIQSKKRQINNRAYKAKVNTTIKSLQSQIANKDEKVSKDKLKEVYALIDKGVKTHVYKQNKASRLKSRLTKKVTSLAAK